MTAIYWPMPIDPEGSEVVQRLITATGNRDAVAFALRLWHHRRRVGELVRGPNALETVARIAGAGPRRGLGKALLEVGLIVERPDGCVEIVAWESVAVVDWSRSGAADTVAEALETTEDRVARARRLARERAQRARDSKRDSGVTKRDASVTKRDGDRDETVTSERDASRSERDDSVTKRDDPAQVGVTPARAYVRDEDEDEDEDGRKEQDPSPAVAAEPSKGPHVVEPPKTLFGEPPPAVASKRSRAASKSTVIVPTGDVAIVWNAYRVISPRSVCTAERVALIGKWLQPVGPYTAEDLERSIAGYGKSPHHNGENSTGTKYLDLELFLRDAKHIEAGWTHFDAKRPGPVAAPAADVEWIQERYRDQEAARARAAAAANGGPKP